MNYEALFISHAKDDKAFIRKQIIQQPDGFIKVWKLVKNGQHPIANRASWTLDHVSEQFPEYIVPLISEMINELKKTHYPGVYRSIARMLERTAIPKYLSGQLINNCYVLFFSVDIPVAVKVYCMQIIYNLSQVEPDLKPELLEAIQLEIPKNSAAFAARGKMLMCKLKKEIGK